MKKLILVVQSILFVVSLSGQNRITGTVFDQVAQSKIIGATIVLSDNAGVAISDKEGAFVIEGLSRGSYTLEISSVGYSTYSLTLDINKDVEVKIPLEEKIFDLPSIVVESVTMTGGISGVKKSLGSAHYIGQKEIQKFSYTDINRTLRNIPGANIQEEDGYGLRPNIGLRATGSERSSKITVMEDGILSAPAPYAAPAAYYFPTVGRMEAIEILKGSSQIKYGPYTTGGAINLISTPLPIKFGGHADFILGSDNYKMLHANLGNAHKNVSYLVETLQYSADGFKELDNGGKTGFNKEDYLAKVRIHTNADANIYQSLTFKIGQAKETSNETYLGLTDEDFALTPTRRYAGSQADLMTTSQSQYSLTHFAQLSSFLDIHTSLYRTEFARNWYKLDKVNGTNIANILSDPNNHQEELSIIRGTLDASNALSVKANNRSYYAQGVQTNAILHFSNGQIKHKLDLGLRIHQDQIDRFQWVDQYNISSGIMQLASSGQPGTESNRVEVANAVSTYAQYKVDLKNLTLTGGLRHEHISIDRADYGTEDPNRTGSDLSSRDNVVSVWIPGIAASYQLSKTSNLFGGAHRGFAPPGSKEGTNPEKSWNYELGYRVNAKGWNAQVTAYHNDYSNLLGADLASSGGTGTQDLFNGGSAIAQGVEAQASYDLLSNSSTSIRLPITAAYTYSRAFFTSSFDSEFDAWQTVEDGDRLPYVPAHQLAISAGIEHSRYLLDISTRYSTAMLTQAGNFDDTNIARTDEAFTVDVALNYKLSKELSAFVNVNNALNNIYVVSRRPSGARPNLPRTFNLGLKANF